MTTSKKVIQANYPADVLAAIVSEYENAYMVSSDNAAILATLSIKYGRTVHSIRAKLSSLKVYKTTNSAGTSKPNTSSKKEDITLEIASIVGQNLNGLEVAPKATLQAILSFVKQQQEKITQLVNDLTEEGLYSDEPCLTDELNDND